jgi:hypothetical protein
MLLKTTVAGASSDNIDIIVAEADADAPAEVCARRDDAVVNRSRTDKISVIPEGILPS